MMNKKNVLAGILALYIFAMSLYMFQDLFITDISGNMVNFGAGTVSVSVPCVDRDGDGYFDNVQCSTGTDCNDFSSSVNPGATEICSDFIDNNCNSIVDTDCIESEQPTDEGGGSGGGGSGRGLITQELADIDQSVDDDLFFGDDVFLVDLPEISQEKYDLILLDRDNFFFDLLQGEYFVDSGNLLNTIPEDLDVSISITGDTSAFIILEENSLVLPSLSRKKFSFAVAAPNDAASGTYEGTIDFSAKGETTSIPITIIVRTVDSPFKIILDADDVYVGEEGKLRYEVGPVPEESDVLVRLRLFDPVSNETLFQSTEVHRFIGTHKEVKKIKLNPDVTAKRYLIDAESFYSTSSGSLIRANSIAFLSVQEKGLLYYARFSIFILLLLASLILGYGYIREKKKRKFNISPSQIGGRIHPGESFQTAIEFKNYSGQQQSLDVQLSGGISNIIKLANPQLILDDNQEVRTIWLFSVDSQAALGTYRGVITVSSETVHENIKVALVVVDPNQNLD